MINWKPASEPPSDGRKVAVIKVSYVRGDLRIARFHDYKWRSALTNINMRVTHWCELSELNLPVGGYA